MKYILPLLLLFLTACPDPGGGGNPTPTPTPTPPPGPQRTTLQELRARQKALADKVQLHPADKTSSRAAVTIARGGTYTLSQLPVDYWDADVAWRLAVKGDPGKDAWFCNWLKERNTTWANYPSGSQNHQFAQAIGPYAAVMVLGQARANQCGGAIAQNAIKVMRDLVNGVWTCCNPSPPSYTGEITGSRHYQQRVWSDQWTLADLGSPPESDIAFQNLDKAVAFLNGKVMANGIWPENTIPRVRPERDKLCYDWPDAVIKKKYRSPPYNLSEEAHPANTAYVSFIMLDYVQYNPDFQGHFASGKCDERSENNNIGYLLGGDRWRPMHTK